MFSPGLLSSTVEKSGPRLHVTTEPLTGGLAAIGATDSEMQRMRLNCGPWLAVSLFRLLENSR